MTNKMTKHYKFEFQHMLLKGVSSRFLFLSFVTPHLCFGSFLSHIGMHTHRFRPQIHLHTISILKAIGHLVLHQQRDAEVQVPLCLSAIVPLIELPPGVYEPE